MDTIETYRNYLEKLMIERANRIWDKRITAQTIFDRERDHYQLVYVGWQESRRVYGVVLHGILLRVKFGFRRMARRLV